MDEFIILHWIYVGVMAAGALTFFLISRNPKGVPKYEYLIAILIPVWSGIAYMSMALEQGKIKIAGQTTFYARYLDWVVTTPLLLLALSLTAMYYQQKNKTLIATIMTADVIMIISGLIADLSLGRKRIIWYLVGMIAFLVILYTIWWPLRNIAREQGAELYNFYKLVAAYLTVLWIGYPSAWLLGPSGLEIISQRIETYSFVILPVLSKLGFSLIDLVGLRSLKQPSYGAEQSSQSGKGV